MFTENRVELRNFYINAWSKHKENLILSPQETLAVDIINSHPEYHSLLLEDLVDKDYDLGNEDNPFLHLSLHLAIREQLSINSPVGIMEIYSKLAKKLHDKHVAEHQVMQCLMEVIYDSQKSGKPLDERQYLNLLQGLLQ